MSSAITEEQIRHVFDLFDADGSGFVDAEELGMALQAVGVGSLPKEEVDAAIVEYCSEGTVHIEYPQFKKIVWSKSNARNSIEEVNAAFQLFSSNQETITVEDFMKVAADVGEFLGSDGQRRENQMRRLIEEVVREAQSIGGGVSGGISMMQWRRMMREAVTDKRHRQHDESAYSIHSRAKIAKKGPFGVKVEAGKTYYWCSCGLSKTQPFCDGSHTAHNAANETSFQPVKFVADETRTVWFCGCKQTKAPPYCDGTHTSL